MFQEILQAYVTISELFIARALHQNVDEMNSHYSRVCRRVIHRICPSTEDVRDIYTQKSCAYN